MVAAWDGREEYMPPPQRSMLPPSSAPARDSYARATSGAAGDAPRASSAAAGHGGGGARQRPYSSRASLGLPGGRMNGMMGYGLGSTTGHVAEYGGTGKTLDWRSLSLPTPPAVVYGDRRGASPAPTSLSRVPSLPKPAWDVTRPGSALEQQRQFGNREPETVLEQMTHLKAELSQLREAYKLSQVERRRLEQELGKARTNVVKAEELLNHRERALSPTMGLSQMYRNPDTTSLVGALRDQMRQLKATRDKLATELDALQRSTRATRMAELQAELFAHQDELQRTSRAVILMKQRMEEAEARAGSAARQAQQALVALQSFMALGAEPQQPAPRLMPGNSLSAQRVRKTVSNMQQAHRVMLQQAQLIQSVFPPGQTMEQFANRAALKASTAGGAEVLRYLRFHLHKLGTELGGQPGARPGDPMSAPEPPAVGGRGAVSVSSPGATAGPCTPPQPSRRTSTSSSPGNAAAAAEGGGQYSGGSSLPQTKEQLASLAGELRGMNMDDFLLAPSYAASVESLAEVATVVVEEVRRLQGRRAPLVPEHVEDEEERGAISASTNPLYSTEPPRVTPADDPPSPGAEGPGGSTAGLPPSLLTNEALSVEEPLPSDSPVPRGTGGAGGAMDEEEVFLAGSMATTAGAQQLAAAAAVEVAADEAVAQDGEGEGLPPDGAIAGGAVEAAAGSPEDGDNHPSSSPSALATDEPPAAVAGAGDGAAAEERGYSPDGHDPAAAAAASGLPSHAETTAGDAAPALAEDQDQDQDRPTAAEEEAAEEEAAEEEPAAGAELADDAAEEPAAGAVPSEAAAVGGGDEGSDDLGNIGGFGDDFDDADPAPELDFGGLSNLGSGGGGGEEAAAEGESPAEAAAAAAAADASGDAGAPAAEEAAAGAAGGPTGQPDAEVEGTSPDVGVADQQPAAEAGGPSAEEEPSLTGGDDASNGQPAGPAGSGNAAEADPRQADLDAEGAEGAEGQAEAEGEADVDLPEEEVQPDVEAAAEDAATGTEEPDTADIADAGADFDEDDLDGIELPADDTQGAGDDRSPSAGGYEPPASAPISAGGAAGQAQWEQRGDVDADAEGMHDVDADGVEAEAAAEDNAEELATAEDAAGANEEDPEGEALADEDAAGATLALDGAAADDEGSPAAADLQGEADADAADAPEADAADADAADADAGIAASGGDGDANFDAAAPDASGENGPGPGDLPAGSTAVDEDEQTVSAGGKDEPPAADETPEAAAAEGLPPVAEDGETGVDANAAEETEADAATPEQAAEQGAAVDGEPSADAPAGHGHAGAEVPEAAADAPAGAHEDATAVAAVGDESADAAALADAAASDAAAPDAAAPADEVPSNEPATAPTAEMAAALATKDPFPSEPPPWEDASSTPDALDDGDDGFITEDKGDDDDDDLFASEVGEVDWEGVTDVKPDVSGQQQGGDAAAAGRDEFADNC